MSCPPLSEGLSAVFSPFRIIPIACYGERGLSFLNLVEMLYAN